MDGTLKTLALVGGAFVALRAAQLYELGDKFDWKVKDVRWVRGSLNANQFALILDLNVINPTSTAVKISDVYGSIYIGQDLLGRFNSGAFRIVPGNNPMSMRFVFNNLETAKNIILAIAARRLPVLDLNIVTRVALFSYTEKMKVNLMDYLKA